MNVVWFRRSVFGLLVVSALASASGCGDRVPVAAPVSVDSLSCAATDPAPGRLPHRQWVRLGVCPALPGGPGPTAPPRGASSTTPPWLVSADLRALAAALAEPNGHLRPGEACPMIAVVPLPPFWLVDGDGQAYRPRIPLDECGRPSDRVVAALSAVTG